MPRSTGSSELIPFDPEPERSLRRRRNFYREISGTPLAHQLQVSEANPNSETEASPEEDQTPPPPPVRKMVKLSDHSMPTAASIPDGFRLPEAAEGPAFDFKPSFLSMLEKNTFCGGATEDPNEHVQFFTDYCSTIRQPGITQSQIRMLLFPFSLRGTARKWHSDLDKVARGIDSWEKLALAFFEKYFPPEKTSKLRHQIQTFAQKGDESLSDAWERFKEMIRYCPHHGIEQWMLVLIFYNNLYHESRVILDSAANGRFTSVDTDDAWGLIEQMAVHNQQYAKPRGNSLKARYDSSSSDAEVKNTLAALCAKIDGMSATGQPHQVNAMSSRTVQSCEACGVLGHTFTECHTPSEQVAAFQSYRNGSPYSGFYNENTKNHPNFSWKNQNNVLNPTAPSPQPPVYQHPNAPRPAYAPPQYQKPSFVPQSSYASPPPTQSTSDLSRIEAMIMTMAQNQKAQDERMSQMMAHNKVLETQIAQMAASSSSRQPGQLPPQGKQPHETLNAISLGSGVLYGHSGMLMGVNDKGAEDFEVADGETGDFAEKNAAVKSTRSSTPLLDRAEGVKMDSGFCSTEQLPRSIERKLEEGIPSLNAINARSSKSSLDRANDETSP